jgi:hypothetical protein
VVEVADAAQERRCRWCLRKQQGRAPLANGGLGRALSIRYADIGVVIISYKKMNTNTIKEARHVTLR